MWCRLVEWIGYTWWARASVCWHLGLYVVARVGCWWSGGHVNVRRQSGSSIQVWSETLLVWRVVVSRQPPLLEPEEASQNNSWRCRIGEQQDSAGRYEEHTTPPYAGARGRLSEQRHSQARLAAARGVGWWLPVAELRAVFVWPQHLAVRGVGR